MTDKELKDILDSLVERYNNTEFIADDPISIPHLFTSREDIEIAGFLSATIAWGNRKSIIRNANRMIDIMGGEPHRFICDASAVEFAELEGFVHRTFNSDDLHTFFMSLHNIYTNEGGIGAFFEREYLEHGDIRPVINNFRKLFFQNPHPQRSEKHLSSIEKGAACKRLNMYIRWMVRDDKNGVDFGLWRDIPTSALYLPLDVHSANVGRALGLLTRKQNDWRSVEEITNRLREFDPSDPVKYDFALFGAGVNRHLLNLTETENE